MVLSEGTRIGIESCADLGEDVAEDQNEHGDDGVAEQAGTIPGTDREEDDNGGKNRIDDDEVFGGEDCEVTWHRIRSSLKRNQTISCVGVAVRPSDPFAARPGGLRGRVAKYLQREAGER